MLPSPDVYEKENIYWPWGALIDAVATLVSNLAAPNSQAFDYMCGTGLLLRKICAIRPDIHVEGCDINSAFVEYANERLQNQVVRQADVREITVRHRNAIILCTGGLHHLDFDEQRRFLERISRNCDANCTIVIGEEVLQDHSTKTERRRAALNLNTELIDYALLRDCPESLIDAALDVLRNDLLLRGEFKRSLKEWRVSINEYFSIIEVQHTWAPMLGGGDVFLVCKPKSRAAS
jgi:hypothetical protein